MIKKYGLNKYVLQTNKSSLGFKAKKICHVFGDYVFQIFISFPNSHTTIIYLIIMSLVRSSDGSLSKS